MKGYYRFVADLRDEELAEQLDAYIAIRTEEYGIFTRPMAFEEMFEALMTTKPKLAKQIAKRLKGGSDD